MAPSERQLLGGLGWNGVIPLKSLSITYFGVKRSLCQGCEFESSCSDVGRFFCSLYSGQVISRPSINDGYYGQI